MKELKIGDPVACYDYRGRHIGILAGKAKEGWYVEFRNQLPGDFHEKQIRRLVKRKSKKAREFWLYRSEFSTCRDLHVWDNNALWAKDPIHVREVTGKPKPRNAFSGKSNTEVKKMLAKAWDNHVCKPDESSGFRAICKELGLDKEIE